MSISPDLIDDLDAKALKTALDLQIPLHEHIGTLRSAIIGLHTYLHGVTHNTAHIDYLLSLIEPHQQHWHEVLTELMHRCALQRLEPDHFTDLDAVYRGEAIAVLTLAADLQPDDPDRVDTLKRYQLYACEALLGADNRPPYFTAQEIAEFIEADSRHPAVLFIRQFSKRLGKPELIRRELSRHYALLEDTSPALSLNLLDESNDQGS